MDKLYTVHSGEEVLIGDGILDKVKMTTQVLLLRKICVQTWNHAFNDSGDFPTKVSLLTNLVSAYLIQIF